MSVRVNRLAVFADLHYTRGSATAKARVLREALDAARACGAEGIACAGDMLGTGSADEARDLRALLVAQPLPVWLTPGNAERRTPSESAAADAILAAGAPPPPEGVVFADSSAGWADPAAVAAAASAGRGLLLVTHVPPDRWGSAAGAAWREALARGAFALAVAGHEHADAVRGDGAIRILRGLDPDKATGGPPSFVVFARGGDGAWRPEAAHEIAGVRPAEWTPDFREAFLDDLGLSTMYDPIGGLAFAAAERVRCVELRHGSWREGDAPEISEAVARWRAAGGRILSLHLPSLRFPPGGAEGVAEVRGACEAALALGCERATLHVPGVPAAEYASRADEVADAYARALAPLAGSGVAVGIENMHTAPGAPPEAHGFGCTPEECLALLRDLRRIPGLEIGFHLDVGHARNNSPYSTLFPVGAWYGALGAACNGMHLHQVRADERGALHNHLPLEGLFDELVSLASLVLARRDGILRRAPMFVEVRGGGESSVRALRAAVSAG